MSQSVSSYKIDERTTTILTRPSDRLRLTEKIFIGGLAFAVWMPSSFAAPAIVPVQASAVSAPQLLTVTDSHGQPGNATYEAGSVNAQVTQPLVHVFLLRNDTHTPITLDHLKSSCPCTTPSFVGASDGATISPGGTFSVQVSVDPNRLSPGLLHKSVWLFVQGQDAPAATLEVTGALLPSVSFSPPSLNFRKLEKGTELTLLLRVVPQTPRMEQGTELRLVSTDPDVSVTRVPSASPTGEEGELPALGSAFRVRLAPHTHTGRLQGKLSLMLVHMDDPNAATGPVVDTVAWLGEAEGSVTAAPSFAAFGTPASGQAVTKKLLLSGKGLGKDVQSLVCTSTSPYVEGTFKAVPGNADQVELDAHLAPSTPLGPFDARLTVTERSGEQLVIPVFAVVKPAAALKPEPAVNSKAITK